MVEQLGEVDFALAAFRRDDRWVVDELSHDLPADVESLGRALGRFADDGPVGALGLVAIDDDFLLILRVVAGRTRLLLSDVTAAEEWDLAQSALEALGLPSSDDDEQVPAGDLDLLGDLGLGEVELGVMLDDPDLYPDELLSDVARIVGFGELFDDVVGLTSA
ncbi:tRNA adenosine deaminase-associated protein [Nocardioides marinquilinus]|uniref:tRNA adenosine deaminase-associated protein n=1 Tax=Nocardioides marinquilinus TaxID=1210400 RepID=A0ABP9P8Y2_9ACTN